MRAIAARAGSALVALGFQVGLALLLVFSFPVMQRLMQEKETILVLPPLPQTPRPTMVIDGRPHPPLRPSAPPLLVTAPPTVAPAPAPARTQAQDEALLRDLGKNLTDCRPGKLGDLPPSIRVLCPSPQARKDDRDVVLANPKVDDERYWESEKANRDAPFALPGAAAGPLGILLTALFNPSAFADKHSYSYGPPLPPKGGVPPGPAERSHASDLLVQNALDAVNARKRALYGKPAPAKPTQSEGAP